MDPDTQVTPKIKKNEIMGGVIPYLSLAQSVDEAIGFYETAFGAVLLDKPARDPEGIVLNATLAINGGAFMLMDHPETTVQRRRQVVKVYSCNWSSPMGIIGGPAQRMQAAT